MDESAEHSLRHRALPEAAAALRNAKAQIMERWRISVERLLPAADQLTRQQLHDSLPALLDQLALALAAGESSAADELNRDSPAHGATRFHQEFSLNELLIEYQILRAIIAEELNRVLKRTLKTEEVVELGQAIDVMMRQAAVEYANYQTAALKIQIDAMTKFLSFLSHDLRGGLNGAVLMLEVLKRGLSDDEKFSEAVEDLEVVRRSILDTVATMERFLHAERLRYGRMPARHSTMNVSEILTELQRGFAFQLNDSDTTMNVRVEPTDLSIVSDRQLLSMILQNLIGNAIKYGQRKPVTVTAQGGAATQQQAGSDVACRFAVSDQGPGIAPERLAELFSPFTQGETYGQKGMGLGLFIARQASDVLGARLWAESKPGEGSTFYLDIKQI